MLKHKVRTIVHTPLGKFESKVVEYTDLEIAEFKLALEQNVENLTYYTVLSDIWGGFSFIPKEVLKQSVIVVKIL